MTNTQEGESGEEDKASDRSGALMGGNEAGKGEEWYNAAAGY